MKRIGLLLTVVFLSPFALAQGQSFIESAQQHLKDQGFYYGGITGQKDSETTAAVRRYQIRNGLKVTGELDADTQRSLGLTGTPTGKFTSTETPTPPEENLHPQDSSASDDQTPQAVPAAPDRRLHTPVQSDQPIPHDSQTVANGVFAGTPYETASLDLQQRTIVGAQISLGRSGLYRGEIDGVFGSGTVAAVRAYQMQMGLPVTARFDTRTLAAMGLLPGQRHPARRMYGPRRIYKGEWIPE